MAETHPNDIGLAAFNDVGDVNLLITQSKVLVEAVNEIKQTGLGTQVYTQGENNTIIGEGNVVYGNDNLVIGHGNIIIGDKQIVVGNEKSFYQWPNNLNFEWQDFSNKKLYFYMYDEPYIFPFTVGDKFVLRTYRSYSDENWSNYYDLKTPLYIATATSVDVNGYNVTLDKMPMPEGTVPPEYIYLDNEYVSCYAVLKDDFKVTAGNFGVSVGNRAEGYRSFTANNGTAKSNYSAALNNGYAENYMSLAVNYGRAYTDYAAALNSGYAYGYYSLAANYGYTFGRGIKCTAINFTSKYVTAATGENVSGLTGNKLFLRHRNGSSYYTATVTVSSVSGQNIYWTENVGSSSYTLMPDGYVFRIESNYGGNLAYGRGLAGGYYTKASGAYTVAAHEGAEICGRYGSTPEIYSWALANGTSHSAHGLAVKMLQNGDVFADGTFSSPCADYAELFEWQDGNPNSEDRAGIFVTLEGDKIKPSSGVKDFILGVISANPAIIGDTGELRWSGKFLTDDFGRTLYHEVTIPAETDEDGNIIKEETVENQPIINPTWDGSQDYIPRSKRKEWSAVGVVGKLRVRDDGSCVPGGLCCPSEGGIAIKSDKKGYKVLKRINDNIILIWFR